MNMEHGWNYTKQNRRIKSKDCPNNYFPPKSHGLEQVRTRTSAVKGRHLTAKILALNKILGVLQRHEQ
jgi:hypothetical protein